MAISKRKLKANQANAQKSTGARTPAGKEKVSQNRTTHGLCGRFRVLPNEDQAAYDALFERFLQAENPADDVERELVAKMARHTWLSERAIRFQEGCITFQPQSPEQQTKEKQTVAIRKDLDTYLRYQAHHDRAYQRAAAELAKRRKESASAQRGFESQKRAEVAEQCREKRQLQHDELHLYKVATAQIRFDHLRQRASTTDFLPQPPKTSQIAA